MKAIKYIITDSEVMLNQELAEFIKNETRQGRAVAVRVLSYKEDNSVCDMALEKADTYRRADGQWLYDGMFVKAETVQNVFLRYSRKVEVYQIEDINAPIMWRKQEV